MSRDLFSAQSESYARYRPRYPDELYQHILGFVEQKNRAWDCATGNGQAAVALADFFSEVKASDISEAQISRAEQRDNIEYLICAAEQTPFADNSFDLITIATVYHWLDWQKFFAEATRVGKPSCVVAAWAYHLLTSKESAINEIILHFYRNITGPYWDPERKHVDSFYSTVQFDFDPLPVKNFTINVVWTQEELKGYFSTWSAVQHFIRKNQHSPLDLIEKDLELAWKNNEPKNFEIPLFLRVGRVRK